MATAASLLPLAAPTPRGDLRLFPCHPAWLRRLVSISSFLFLAQAAAAQTVLVQPYVQPGDGRTLTDSDVKVLHWFTDQVPAEFIVEYQLPFDSVRTAKVMRRVLDFPVYQPELKDNPGNKPAPGNVEAKSQDKEASKEAKEAKPPKVQQPPEKDQHYFKYTAVIDALPFNSSVHYRVRQGARVIRSAAFRTRATADQTVRCVMVGDMAQGRKEQRPIAYQISRQQPDFLIALGDIVYPTGRVSQYMQFFWGTYNNVSQAAPETGAPLMASVPFYPVLGNHDVSAKLPKVPDAFGAYYFFSPPKGGPGDGPWITPLGNDKEVAARFRAATLDSYPNLDAYSFDFGPAHVLVLNDNPAMKTDAPAFQKWLADDLLGTKAKWKFVCYHMPGFHSSIEHYTDQQIRPLQPLFEKCGVDITFAGHVHNYQRTVPLMFAPDGPKDKKGRVNGQFTLDTAFDGVNNTRPSGVIHIVAGGGGASLYKNELATKAAKIKKEHGSNYADYTVKAVSDKHSFVVLDVSPTRLDLSAVSASGEVLDHITIDKGSAGAK